jgi:hypothetical protein
MKLEITYNTLDDELWWFDLGISAQKTFYEKTNYVIAIGLIFFTIYIRW